MEIVLQWMDDLEDMVFALPLLWERLRIWFLQLGLIAAIALHADSIWQMAGWWAPLCAATACLVATGWFAALAASQARRRPALGDPAG